ncbi:MAG: hypothetical protein NTV89_07910 [Proteobacteria bacterium]|nr:hypothetical protein [Pseudomonadota bacterium]
MKTLRSASVCCALAIAILVIFPIICPAASPDRFPKDTKGVYDLTCKDISASFQKFMQCNSGKISRKICDADPDSAALQFSYNAVKELRNYHVIMLPGGEFDFFDELLGFCDGRDADDLEELFNMFPAMKADMESAVKDEVCPDYEQDFEDYYDALMDGFITYEMFLGSHDISFTRLQFSQDDNPYFAGDRAEKVSLLADTIDRIEGGYGANEFKKNYILIGHSFGGINITDFLAELLNAHVPGTPEYRMFEATTVRQWPAEKKERIFNKIKALALINTFVQGDRTEETLLLKTAKEQGITASDPVEYYIDYVLKHVQTEVFTKENIKLHQLYHNTLLSNRYRGNYYFTDKNSVTPKTGTPIKDAFDRIAREKAVISVGCSVPKYFPYLMVGPNMLVASSKDKWKEENIRNDGLVDSFASIIPRENVEFVLLPNLDHGALVLKPEVAGISVGHEYDQTPFVRTLFKRLSSRMKEIQAAQTSSVK